MRLTRLQRWFFGVALSTGTLLACNAIVGVEDVRLAKAGRDAKADAGDPDPEEDAGPDEEDAAPLEPGTTEGVTLGFLHGCSRAAGAVRCWGENASGQIGDGTPVDAGPPKEPVLSPQPVSGLGNVTALGAGERHTCAVQNEGSVSCWGYNASGQLGDGSKESSSKPVTVPGIADAIEVVGGVTFSCALKKTKTVVCWGLNSSGQIGDGTKVERLAPKAVVGVTDAVSIGAGHDHACAVLGASGDVMCWGKNTNGQLGINTVVDTATPTKVMNLTDVAQVAGAASFTCARQKGGAVFCWGNNVSGQLGTGSTTPAQSPVPVAVPSITDAKSIWTGWEHACAVRQDGTVSCWGRGKEGQLGIGPGPDEVVATPTKVVGVADATAVWTGGDRSCALLGIKRVLCWGSNQYGQLGNGTNQRAFSATAVKE